MIPIYEQGHGKGIGYCLGLFLKRFDAIIQDYADQGQENAFALILYDFNSNLRDVLKNQGAFAKLDRLAGKNLSIFYLHAPSNKAVKTFNETFLYKIGFDQDVSLPSIVFFRFARDHFIDIKVIPLSSPTLIHGLGELIDVIDKYKANQNLRSLKLKHLKIIEPVSKIIATETLRAALRSLLRYIL